MTTANSTQMIFRYSIITRLFTIIFNIAAFATPMYLIGNVVLQQTTENMSVLPTVLYSIFLGVVLVITANFYPEIIADQKGLQVQFLWYRLPVLWQDIVEVKPSWFNLPNRPTTWVVQTRKLSQFHRLYGLLYSSASLPSFIVRYEIENREAILEMIKRRRFVQPNE